MPATADDRVLSDLRGQAAALSPGGRLPSVRDLVRRHRASPVTVQRAVARLAAEGLVVARPGRGTFVAGSPVRSLVEAPDFSWQAVALGAAGVDPGGLDRLLAMPADDVISLSSGFVEADLLPMAALAAASTRAARRAESWARVPLEGVNELRAWFARDAGGGLTASDVVITPGAQAALATVFRALGRRGDSVLVEAPTYIGALAAARGAGLVPVPVPVDGDGVRVDLLEETLTRTGARLIMLQPTYANPHGSVLSERRRDDVLELARAHGAFVVEDEYARDLGLDGVPPPAPLVSRDPHGHVVYIRSLTKSTAPSLRVAGVAARGPAGMRFRGARVVDDFFVSGLLQQTALELVASTAWLRHLRGLRRELAHRRDVLLALLARDLPDWRPFGRPRGGLCLWVELPADTDEAALAEAAAAAGVLVFPGRPWFPAEPPAPYLRLSYASASEQRLREGLARLAKLAG